MKTILTLFFNNPKYLSLLFANRNPIQLRPKQVMKMKQNFSKLSLLCSIVFAHILQAQSQSFIVGVVQFVAPNVNRFSFRCYGTIFTPNHVLTTASCASVVSPFAVACQHQEAIRSPNGTSIRTCKWNIFNCSYY